MQRPPPYKLLGLPTHITNGEPSVKRLSSEIRNLKNLWWNAEAKLKFRR
jgi:hypothetical protein